MDHGAALVMHFILEPHCTELEVVGVTSHMPVHPLGLVVGFVCLVVLTLVLAKLHDHLLLFVVQRHLLVRVGMVSLRDLRDLRRMI